MGVLAEHQVTDLTSSVDRVQGRQHVSVPESDVSISSSTTRSQKTTLVRTPTDSFYGRCVLAELDKGLVGVERPNQKFIIVAS